MKPAYFLLLCFPFAAIISLNSSAQNIGIGTTTPVMKLHISSGADTALQLVENTNTLNVNTNTGIYFKNGSYFTGAIKTIGTGTVLARMGLYTYAVSDQNNLRERISIADNGNVGIDMVDPVAKLDINGTLKIRGGGPGVGKILTSDADGLASWEPNAAPNSGFKAVVGAGGFNVSSSANTTLIFTLKDYDDPVAFFSSTFTAPSTGLYHFDALLHWSISAVGFPTEYIMYMVVNGAQRHGSILDLPAGASGFRPQALSTDIKLTAGDNVEIVVFQNSGILQSIIGLFSGIRYSYFSGRRVY